MTPPRASPSSATSRERALADHLEEVRASMVEVERAIDLSRFGPRRESARNLLHYLAFRRFDLRRDQTRLAHLALSSLGRSEGHVLYNLDAVLGWLDRLDDVAPRDRSPGTGPDPESGRRFLEANARTLLGPTRPGRRVRIMVTMPAEAATDGRLVRRLIESGMDCARINCAHERPTEWARMISHIRQAERSYGRRCRIEMDLAGPKIRTGTIQPGPAVMKLRPERDVFGKVTSPLPVSLVPSDVRPSRPLDGKRLTFPGGWLTRRRPGESVEFVDARGARRALRIVSNGREGCRAEISKTSYIAPGTRFVAVTDAGREDPALVEEIAAVERRIRLEVGDRLIVTSRPEPGEEARRDSRGRVLRPAHIACTLPEGLGCVRRGEPVWFDDGRIGSIVRSATPERLTLEVTHAPPGGAWLAADKGINLPGTNLDLPTIPPKDLEDLRFIVRNADLVGLSFVHTPADVDRLRAELARLGRPRMGIVLKVETRRAFEELPGILLAALRRPPVGVMIARGDLAVEVGFERLAEVQEEILWLCEAAHLPAIWATQVLEELAKTGMPSRAEVTDAAMGERAECVMLNKGPHIVEAVGALDGILRRMQSHQAKKTAMLRHLHIVERFLADHRRG